MKTFLVRLLAPQLLAERELLLCTLERIQEAADAIDQELSDPHGDGTGDDSRPPDADSYNDLISTVTHLAGGTLAKIKR
jgi:hypothetical protein